MMASGQESTSQINNARFVMAVVWFYLTDVKKGKRDGKVIEGEGK